MSKDTIGDRFKEFEQFYSYKLLKKLPIICRLDGRSFHKWTKKLNKPYDERFCLLMGELTKLLIKECNANLGYTQSDEISLILTQKDYKSQAYFDGKIFKIISVLSSFCSVHFNILVNKYISEKSNKIGLFDCRIFQVPDLDECVNYLIWREQDATRNAIQSATRTYYSHKEVNNKNTSEMQEMLFKKNINFNNYPNYFKRGQYLVHRETENKFTTEEINKLPKNHQAHKNPELKVIRRVISYLYDLPILTKIDNPVDVLFNNMLPRLKIC